MYYALPIFALIAGLILDLLVWYVILMFIDTTKFLTIAIGITLEYYAIHFFVKILQKSNA